MHKQGQSIKSALRLYRRARKGYLLCPTLFTIQDVLDFRWMYYKLLNNQKGVSC